jgi:hypothetical protein
LAATKNIFNRPGDDAQTRLTLEINFLKLKIQTMGTISGGVLGGFNGKVGAVVGSHWKGKSVMRGRSTKKKAKSSVLQLVQQAKFALMVNFLQAITDFLNVSYKKAAVQMLGFNKALSTNIQFAVTGTYPDFTIDYPKVQLSRGVLPNIGTPSAASTVAGKVAFTWTDNPNVTGALSSDIAYVAAYNEELKHWIINAPVGLVVKKVKRSGQ